MNREHQVQRLLKYLKIAIKKNDALSVSILMTRIENLGFKLGALDD